ncbi:MAG: hypothetical protein LBU11_08480 [Zoogloeaceae bacterium]|jgi:hypothetical protein|nr:hypothetical protein [Zoogloeaceae bacterium]
MSKDDWKQLLLLVGLAGIGISVMVFSVRSLRKKYAGDNWIWGQALKIWLLGTLAVFFLSILPFVLVEPDWGSYCRVLCGACLDGIVCPAVRFCHYCYGHHPERMSMADNGAMFAHLSCLFCRRVQDFVVVHGKCVMAALRKSEECIQSLKNSPPRASWSLAM